MIHCGVPTQAANVFRLEVELTLYSIYMLESQQCRSDCLSVVLPQTELRTNNVLNFKLLFCCAAAGEAATSLRCHSETLQKITHSNILYFYTSLINIVTHLTLYTVRCT